MWKYMLSSLSINNKWKCMIYVSDKLYKVLFSDDTTVLYSHKDPDEIVKVWNQELIKLNDLIIF